MQDRHAAAGIDDDAEFLREQVALRDEIIAEQQAIIDTLGAPIIPVSPLLAVMPFVGPLDDERIDRACDRLLHAIAGSTTRVVVIDLTGITSFEMSATLALRRMLGALALLGARMVMTGIAPKLALTLGAGPLPRVETHTSLQSAIAAHGRGSGPA
jgi:rsbT co-antagonist protein RsbR